MNRRAFLKFLGIGVPAVTAASIMAPKVEKVVEDWSPYPTEVKASLDEWNNFYSEADPELMKSFENWKSYPVHRTANLVYDREMVQRLKFDDRELFTKLASRNDLHIGAPVSREFFQYNVKS